MKSLREYIEELRSLDQNNIGSWPTWAYGLAILLVCAVIIGVGTWYFVLPKQESLERIARQEPELKQTFESKQRLVANLDAYRTQLEAMAARMSQSSGQSVSADDLLTAFDTDGDGAVSAEEMKAQRRSLQDQLSAGMQSAMMRRR